MSLLQIERALQLALDQCAANGLTTVHEANTSSKMLKALRSIKKKKKLNIRVYVMLDGTDKNLVESFLKKGPEIDDNHMLITRCIKIFVDGALGSRGAALIKPYSDAPGVNGVIVTPGEALYGIGVQSLKSGFQVAVHAIGDLANRITLQAYQRALKEVPKIKDHRLRLEHARTASKAPMPGVRFLTPAYISPSIRISRVKH